MAAPSYTGPAIKSNTTSSSPEYCDRGTSGCRTQTPGVLKGSVNPDRKGSRSASTTDCQRDAQPHIPMPQANFPNLPNYFAHMDVHRAPKPISPAHCQHSGGVHISWLHYCFLCFTIFCMAVVVTLFTTVALHRSDPMFALADFRAPVPMQNFQQVGKPATPEINFSPSIVCGPPAAKDENLKFLLTRRLPVTVVETVTAMPMSPTAPQCPSATTVTSVKIVAALLPSSATVQCPLPSTATITTWLGCSATTVFSTITEQTVIPGLTATIYSTVIEQVTLSLPNVTVTVQSILTITLSATTSIPTTLIKTTTVIKQPPPTVSSTTFTTLIPDTMNRPLPTTRYFHSPS